jgi:signal transduction histidine kinase
MLSLIMAVSLAVFFGRVVTNRHQVLVDNTVRLAKREPLNPPLAGADEIAHLDHVFHAMVESLAAADKVKKQLISMVSHELRTPLTSVSATLPLLAAGALGELPGPAVRRLTGTESDVNRLISLINDLLDIEKMEAGKLEMRFASTKAQAVLARALMAVCGFAENKGVTITAPESEAVIWADEGRLIQVLVNLLSNAIKFSPPGGTIAVTVNVSPQFVEFRVHDEGRGVPREHQERIFERFAQVQSTDATVKGGTGLGLAISKAIVVQHGGSIGVESLDDQGSTFWFQIPVQAPPERSAESQQSVGLR